MSNIDEIAFVWSSRFVKANSRNLTDYLKYKNKSIPKRIIISYDYPYRVVDPAEVVDSNKVLNWADFVRDNYEIYIGSLDSVQRLVPRLEQSNSNPKLISSLIELEFYNEGLYYNMELYNKYRNMLERRKDAEYYASTMFITLYQMIKTSKIVLNEVLNDRGEPYVNLNVFPRFFNK